MQEPAELKAPVMLLAMPQVLDPFFRRSVVLLVHHDDEGSLGFIVNRPTGIKIGDILGNMEISWGGDPAAVAHFGGPVQPQLGSVLYAPAAGAETVSETTTAVVPGMSLTHHVSDLALLAAEPPASFRLLLGYAGWGAGQLVEELSRHDWLIAPVAGDVIFAGDRIAAWEAAVRSVGVDPSALPAWTDGDAGAN